MVKRRDYDHVRYDSERRAQANLRLSIEKSPMTSKPEPSSCSGMSMEGVLLTVHVVSGEYQVRICERLRVQFPGPTRRKCLGSPGLQVGVVPGLAIFFEQRNRLLVSLKLHLV